MTGKLKAWLGANCTFLWRTVFTLALGGIAATVWHGAGKLGELVIALNGIPAAVERIEQTIANHEGRILVLEALRDRDGSHAK